VGEVSSGLHRIRGKLRAARLVGDGTIGQEPSNNPCDAECDALYLIAGLYGKQTFLDDEDEFNHPLRRCRIGLHLSCPSEQPKLDNFIGLGSARLGL
jgi:hypothetical protein